MVIFVITFVKEQDYLIPKISILIGKLNLLNYLVDIIEYLIFTIAMIQNSCHRILKNI